MEKKQSKFSWAFVLLLTLSMVNLMMMHFLQQREGILEAGLVRVSWVNCLISCLLDVTVLYLLSLLVMLLNRSRALALTFVLTWLISIFNVFYGRFFGAYLPLTAVTEVRNLTDGSLLSATFAAIRPVDIYYPIALAVFIPAYRFLSKKVHGAFLSLGVMWLAYLLLMCPAYYNYTTHSTESFAELFQTHMLPEKISRQLHPSRFIFNTGLVRGSWADAIGGLFPKHLTPEEESAIELASDPSLHGTLERTALPQVNNVIFILVESYLSMVSDMKVGDVEVTPFLNRLRHSEGVYYNGQVKVNITLGESADGQLIYMTGLLPLRGEISVSRILGKTLPGLPEVMGYAPSHSRIIIPTKPSLWQQDHVSRSYGFGQMLSRLDAPKEWNADWLLNDEQIFTMARQMGDENTPEPFFSLILTFSMHSPYVQVPDYIEGVDFSAAKEEYSEKFCNYLACCHYTDARMEEYFDYLKESGLYDKSLIVIISDHQAHDNLMDLTGQLSWDIPLYIVNGGIHGASADGPGVPAWDGPCNQIDVYSTILDIMGSQSQWRGLGCSLLMDPWQDYANDQMWSVSEDIIYANYFKGAGY